MTKTEIQFLESGIHSLKSRIQDCLRLPYKGRLWFIAKSKIQPLERRGLFSLLFGGSQGIILSLLPAEYQGKEASTSSRNKPVDELFASVTSNKYKDASHNDRNNHNPNSSRNSYKAACCGVPSTCCRSHIGYWLNTTEWRDSIWLWDSTRWPDSFGCWDTGLICGSMNFTSMWCHSWNKL